MAKRTQRYESQAIAVTFDPNRCIHAARCLQRLPAVFDVNKKRWIAPEEGTADDIAETVRQCPSGALAYERRDGGAAEWPDETVTVVLQRNGPAYVRGDVELVDREGGMFKAGPRIALCRCGASENKPYCDNSHRDIGFKG